MKKLLTLLLALAMIVSMVACNKDVKPQETKAPGVTSPSETKNNAGEENKDDEPLHVEVLGGIPSNTWESYTKDNNPTKTIIEEMLNIEIEFPMEASTGEDLMRLLSLSIASGEIPDIMMVTDRTIVNELVENDLIWDLTEVWEEYASDEFKAVYDSFNNNYLETYGAVGGRLMAIPRATGDLDHLIYIRQDWVDKLGLKIDEDGDHVISKDELEMVVRAFVENDPGNSGNPVGISFTGSGDTANLDPSPFFQPMEGYYKKWLVDENGQVYSGSLSEEMKNCLGWFAELYKEGLIDPQLGVTSDNDYTAMMAQNRLGIVTGEGSLGVWLLLETLEADPEAYFKVYTLAGESGITTWGMRETANRWVCVSKEFEHPELAIKMLEAEYQLANGDISAIPGTEVLAGVSRTTYMDFAPLWLDSVAFDPEGLKSYRADPYKALNGKMDYDDLDATAKSVYDAVVKCNNEGWASMTATEKGTYIFYETLGISLEVQATGKAKYTPSLLYGVTPTMITKQAELDTFELETWIKIITGEEPLEYFDTFVKEYNKRGGAAIRDEIQAIYDLG